MTHCAFSRPRRPLSRALIGGLGLLIYSLTSTPAHAAGSKRPRPEPTRAAPKFSYPSSDRIELDDSHIAISRMGRAMDRDLGMNMNLDGTESGLGTDFETHGTVAGKEKSLLSSSTEISPATNDGSTDFYLDGMQLASITYPLNSILKKSYQIAPVNLSATAVNVPVGPLIVSAKAGVSVEAKVDAEITPYAGIPLDQSYIELKLDPVIRAQAYTEGIATLLVVRGGIRGAVTLIDANLRMLSQVRFNQERPHVAMHGNLEFLSGELYGFAEVFSVLGWDWARFWKASFFEWAGKCYQFEQNREVAGACPSHD